MMQLQLLLLVWMAHKTLLQQHLFQISFPTLTHSRPSWYLFHRVTAGRRRPAWRRPGSLWRRRRRFFGLRRQQRARSDMRFSTNLWSESPPTPPQSVSLDSLYVMSCTDCWLVSGRGSCRRWGLHKQVRVRGNPSLTENQRSPQCESTVFIKHLHLLGLTDNMKQKGMYHTHLHSATGGNALLVYPYITDLFWRNICTRQGEALKWHKVTAASLFTFIPTRSG